MLLLIGGWSISKLYPQYRNFLMVVSVFSYLIYIVWRATTIPFRSGAVSVCLGILLYGAELMGGMAFFNFQYLFMGKRTLTKKTMDEFKEMDVPLVDVLICTYNEPLYLLEMTIAAATNMEYPDKRFNIYICDDGRREELKTLCEKYEIGYISRNDNTGAKAGNINNALGYIQGELFAVLDADMIPKKEFLSKTIGYFSDPNVAFVQTPQVYYNQDMYQYNLSKRIPNEQDFFMRDIQTARASKNATLHVGTNAVFRRAFVLDIGGYPNYSITEDMAIGMTLQAKGYDSVFVNEELVYGLSAATFSELVKQRDRWCRGNLQVIKNNNILLKKGLSLGQKIAYLDGGLYWLANIQKMIFILFPILYLLTGITIMTCRLNVLLPVLVPHLVGEYLVFSVLAPNTRSIRWSHYYETIMAPYLSLSIIKEFLNLKICFNVTAKDTIVNKKTFQGTIVFPHIVLFFLTILAWGISLLRLVSGSIYWESYVLNFLWSLFNMTGLIMAIRIAWQKPMYRKVERVLIKRELSCSIRYKRRYIYAVLKDISGCGAGLMLNRDISFKIGQKLHLDFGKVQIPCYVVRNEKNEIGVEFKKLTPESMKCIMSIFCENIEPYYKFCNGDVTSREKERTLIIREEMELNENGENLNTKICTY